MSAGTRARRLLTAMVLVTVCSAPARAEDVAARKIYIKDNADPAKRQLQVQSSDAGVQLSEADDPVSNGASVHVYSATDDFCVPLAPGASWQNKGTISKFKDSATKDQAQIGDGQLKIKIKSGVTFTLADDGSQGTVNVQVQFGTGTRYCLRCPGNTKDDADKFLGKMCTAAACDPEPPNCTPLECGNGVLAPGEQCDDGNNVSGDGCETDCTLTQCASASGPDCDGFCAGPGSACIASGGGCQCAASTAPCGSLAAAPQCLGECPPSEICMNTGGTCACTPIDASTMDQKMLMGYQGWFSCPGDGSSWNNWFHWSTIEPPAPNTVTVDMWPDTSELEPDELCATSFTRPDDSPAPLYSSYNHKTTARHFKWMMDYALDGVLQQRFISRVPISSLFAFDTQVLRNTRAGAEAYGRVFAVEYALSDQLPDLVATIEQDWTYLVDTLGITDSPRYLRHKGRPVVGIFGFGFPWNPTSPAQAAELIAYFQSNADPRYRATVMGGVPWGWRTLSADSSSDPAWASVYRSLDVISPWVVGLYRNEAEANQGKQNLLIPDRAEATANGVEYMPVVFPGFSWHNLWSVRGTFYPFNQIPRNGGRLYWRQVYNTVSTGNTMLFGAMFDEVDEGTAMYKVAPTAAEMPAQGTFVPLNIDGESLPSDWYLRLAGEAGKMLRGDIPLSPTIPITP